MTDDPTALPHKCPGGCGTTVRRHLLACGTCWRMLPGSMRSAITHATKCGNEAARLRTVAAALTWYRQYRKYGQENQP
jgi:hypothetical protein